MYDIIQLWESFINNIFYIGLILVLDLFYEKYLNNNNENKNFKILGVEN